VEGNTQEEYNVLIQQNFVQFHKIFVLTLAQVRDFAIKEVAYVKILQLKCIIAIWLFKIIFLILYKS